MLQEQYYQKLLAVLFSKPHIFGHLIPTEDLNSGIRIFLHGILILSCVVGRQFKNSTCTQAQRKINIICKSIAKHFVIFPVVYLFMPTEHT